MIPCINNFSMFIRSKDEIEVNRTIPTECKIQALRTKPDVWTISIEMDQFICEMLVINQSGYPIQELTNIMKSVKTS